VTITEVAQVGGSADGERAHTRVWSWSADVANQVIQAQEGELPAAMFTTYAPPHPLALSPDDADHIIGKHGSTLRTATRAGNRAPLHEIPCDDLRPDLRDHLTRTVDAANRSWWRLDLEVLTLSLARYPLHAMHREHQDMHPGSMQRKLALSIQLSDPADYDGGDLMLRCWHEEVRMPRHRGTVVAFPGWTSHRVTPVERGERWALIVWAWGRPVR
jgi:hypothetical protein